MDDAEDDADDDSGYLVRELDQDGLCYEGEEAVGVAAVGAGDKLEIGRE